MTSETTFWDAVDEIRTADPRYRREAYGFVMAALGPQYGPCQPSGAPIRSAAT